ncbi:MerR family transcriptional regulator [Actibacterium sp. XHP0104]|uniref:MerR family transcriptional regulator n=1 Tax=Actibacterium sp. XHP0104 TaxID=2984335 RepID=UPI0021E9385B|nr:MerR family transcriptional regulator [Actibacterium sp. XHP0104]MCV2881203.1 MerR family transcriptional regulator [Actibacterium sp. XHP0104]
MEKKSPDALRTISEVSEWLETPAHVLRFWESRFTQVKPVKRAGGRRYYRPNDMLLLGGLKKLLHEDGMTIRGAQKILRDKGVKHVAGMSQPLGHEQDHDHDSFVFHHVSDPVPEAPMAENVESPEPEEKVVQLKPRQRVTEAEPELPFAPEATEEPASVDPAPIEAPAAANDGPRAPLGADLPANDPEDDDFALEMPLVARLSSRDARAALRATPRPALRAMAERLDALRSRMGDDE